MFQPRDYAPVLLVDDDEELREAERAVLEEVGYRVYEAPDGNAALTLLASLSPSIVLLDWCMPEMSGHQVLATMAANERLAVIPVVICSGEKLDSDALGKRGIHLLKKPIAPLLLLQTVADWAAGPVVPESSTLSWRRQHGNLRARRPAARHQSRRTFVHSLDPFSAALSLAHTSRRLVAMSESLWLAVLATRKNARLASSRAVECAKRLHAMGFHGAVRDSADAQPRDAVTVSP